MSDKELLGRIKKIIDSCITKEQLDVAERYAKLAIDNVFFHDSKERWGENFIRNYSRIIIRRLISDKKAKLIHE